jgi:pimeloyl-ACP methyl ester carboxylesterase
MHYSVFGSGPRALLAFHGFGGAGTDWHVFENELGKDFTIYAFDIFFHGKSQINAGIDKPNFDKAALGEIVEVFMKTEKLTRVSLMGYSLGGKLCLCLIELMPGKIDHVFLMAPDGIKIGFWNRFVSQTVPGRLVFDQVVKNPKPALALIGYLRKGKLIHQKVDSFLRIQLEEVHNRERILKMWLLFKDLIPDHKRIQKHIFRYNINIEMFFGKYDLIIPAKLGIEFQKGLKKPALHILECGHLMNNNTLEICTVIKSKLT